jgi:hypothetical protein
LSKVSHFITFINYLKHIHFKPRAQYQIPGSGPRFSAPPHQQQASSENVWRSGAGASTTAAGHSIAPQPHSVVISQAQQPQQQNNKPPNRAQQPAQQQSAKVWKIII